MYMHVYIVTVHAMYVQYCTVVRVRLNMMSMYL